MEKLDGQLTKQDEQMTKQDEQMAEQAEQMTKQDEQMAEQAEQMAEQAEQIAKQDERMATCVKDIDDMKKKSYDTDDSQERKRKRLYDDTRTLIEEDLREDTFVITKAITDGLLLLEQNGVLLITGYAGTGKSRIGRHVLHMYCTDDTSYKCIKLNTLDEWEDMVSREDNVVVLLDDIFGETNCIYKREKDIPILDKVYAYVCKGNIKVIITIRDTVKRQCREVFDNHRLFKFDFIDLGSDKYELSQKEKHAILTKYMKAVKQSEYADDTGFINYNGVTILRRDEACKIVSENPVKVFPLAIYQFVHNAKYFQLGIKFFDRPTEAMLEEMNKIRRKGEDHLKFMIQYAVMVYTSIKENYINPEDSWHKNAIEKIIEAIYGKTIKLKTCHISDAVTELKGSYLVTKPNERSYIFHHPTLQESVILSFAQIDEKHFKNIIPLLSWSFFLKMVKSDEYIEKEGEVILKIPPNSYKLLAYRLKDIYFSKMRNSPSMLSNVYCFLAEVIDTEVFQQKSYLLLTYLLEAFEKKKDERINQLFKSLECSMKSMLCKLDSCDEHMKSMSVFLANFLVSIANTKEQFKVYNFILEKCNQIIKTSNNYFTNSDMKAALITSLYEICSTKDVGCVKATLNLVKEEKITVLLDQGINLTIPELEPNYSFTVGYSYNDHRCVFLVFCIWKAYEAFNEPVLEYLLSMYNKISFDVNLLLKTFYRTDWLVGLTFLSYKPLKWVIERFEDLELVKTDFILKTACQCHLFDTVQYLSSRCETFDAIFYLKRYLYEDGEEDKQEFISRFDFDKDLFNFLFSKIDITSPEMNDIVSSVFHKPNVPDYVCDAVLPFCINNEAILTLACREAHIYITKLILDNSHNITIQSALTSACLEKETNVWGLPDSHVDVIKLEIVKFIIGKYGYKQFDLKVVCQQAYQKRKYIIIEWFALNFDITLLDVHCIINFALVCEKSEILQDIINTINITRLDKLEVLRSVTEHFTAGCSAKILQIVSFIWDSTEDKEELKMEEIVDMAYEKRSYELIIWIHENCKSHFSIDAKKVFMSACEYGRIDVAKWILHSFEQTSLDIDERELLMLACGKMSNFEYQVRKITMVKWVIITFQIKPLHLKLGILKLTSNNKMRMWPIKDKFFELLVSTLKHYFNFLSTEDKVEIMNKCLEQKYYDVVNWLFENESFCSFDKQLILNNACKDDQIETIKMLNKYFHSLDMNEAVINACTGYDLDISVGEYLLIEIDHDSLDISRIVTTVCKNYVSDNVLKFLLIKFSDDQNIINKVLISCCQQGKFNLLKHIFLTIHNDQLDILTAFLEACLHPHQIICNSEKSICVIDFLFEKLQDKSYNASEVLSGLLDMKSYNVILYFLEQGYCGNFDKKNLMIEACRHGHVKLVQWIFENVDHKELDIKSAFLEACIPTNMVTELQLHCVALMWHYIQDINMFEVDTVLKSITGAPPDISDINVKEDLRNWLLYIKNIHQRMMS
ncbi:uncharacterized protein LOC127712205 isoform X2 [Mytilus californianus]|uniref:uncharacterized protein LOC127712205 isoform X2 n=1 Tax=Mytilus californianus TaxID=6549 RepID=UPI0022484D3F|nr:uncharacterized protein LOC127712205 isoform X2 [Mytilus californianus]